MKVLCVGFQFGTNASQSLHPSRQDLQEGGPNSRLGPTFLKLSSCAVPWPRDLFANAYPARGHIIGGTVTQLYRC